MSQLKYVGCEVFNVNHSKKKDSNFDFGLVYTLVTVRKKGSNLTMQSFQYCTLYVRFYTKPNIFNPKSVNNQIKSDVPPVYLCLFWSKFMVAEISPFLIMHMDPCKIQDRQEARLEMCIVLIRYQRRDRKVRRHWFRFQIVPYLYWRLKKLITYTLWGEHAGKWTFHWVIMA